MTDEVVKLARSYTPKIVGYFEDMASKPDLQLKKPPIHGEGAFYIYRIFGYWGETLYIGKGSGRRLASQKRKFGCDGEIIYRCRDEKSAYRAEVRFIKKLKPSLNKNGGGLGGYTGRGMTADERLMKQIGTRAFAARILLWCYHHPNDEIHKLIDHTKYDEYRQVAYGTA